MNTVLLGTGIALFAVGHLTAMAPLVFGAPVCSYGFRDDQTGSLHYANVTAAAWPATAWIPVAGGLIAAAGTQCPTSSFAAEQSLRNDAGPIAAGIVGTVLQTAGVILAVLGVRGHDVRVRRDDVHARAVSSHGIAAWAVVPYAGSLGWGLSASVQTF